MPSGYTSDLYDLKSVSFQDFVVSCATAFIPEARDSGMLKRLPDSPSRNLIDHYYKSSIEAVDALEKFMSLSYEEIAQMNEDDYAKNLAAWKSYYDRSQKVLSAYNDMLVQVMQWVPPTDRHQGLKDFMIEQLENSIRFDGTVSHMPKPITTEEYKTNKLDRLARDVQYYKKEHEAAVQRYEDAVDWLDGLKQSIGIDTTLF